jgi:hypothetical protein
MNEEDLRDCFAMFRSIGGGTAEENYRFADMMLEARKKKYWVENEDGGITTVARRTYRKKKDE